MRRHFIPHSYQRVLYKKLEQITQGSKSVDEYYKELEIAIIQAKVNEDEVAMMEKFLHGLNHEIVDVVAMHYYEDLDDMIEQAIRVEALEHGLVGYMHSHIKFMEINSRRDEVPSSTRSCTQFSKDVKQAKMPIHFQENQVRLRKEHSQKKKGSVRKRKKMS